MDASRFDIHHPSQGSGRESHHRFTYRDETKQRLCYDEPIKMNTIVQNDLWLSSVPAYYQYSCTHYLILDVVAMTDVRAKKLTKQDEKRDPACTLQRREGAQDGH